LYSPQPDAAVQPV